MTTATTLSGFEERFADVKGVRLRYLVAGDGPPLVLVHGLSGAASNWIELAPQLAGRFRVLVPDLPGHGGSSPLPAAPGLDAYADGVHALAVREGIERAPYVGHSMGGVVSLRLALRHPGAVSGIVLAAAAGIGSATRRAEFWITVFGLTRPGRKLAPHRRRVARNRLLRAAVFNPVETSDPLSLSEAGIDGLLGSGRLHSDVISAGRALVADDPRVDLDRVACPCLVLWGARDLQVPVDDAFEYARRLRAPLRVIADAGHLIVVERPQACLDAIEGFVDGLAPA
jgi:pimeloyl-ACP methyl ester carboxylesterase